MWNAIPRHTSSCAVPPRLPEPHLEHQTWKSQVQLTIKETARSIRFPAIIAMQEDGALKAQAAFDLDRTLWDVCYGSGKLYERLGMHLVNDLISIELFIVAREAV